MAGTLYLVMGAPNVGTCTLMKRVRDALADSTDFAFPMIVASGAVKQEAEVVTPDEFQRRKVSGDLQLFWKNGDVEVGYRSFLGVIESGVNVAIEVPQSVIAKVEKLFFYHKKRIIYVTASQEIRKQRAGTSGHPYVETSQSKPQGPNVSTVVNSGTISEGAADVIGTMKQHGKESLSFPPCAVSITVLRNAQNATREYLSEQVIPGLTNALTAISQLPVKPKNPYLWLSEYLETNANLGGQGEDAGSSDPLPALLVPGGYICRLEQAPHVLDEPPSMQGLANLRRSPQHDRLVGVGQPSTSGIRELVAELCGSHGEVVWLQCRDSPVLYINQHPHTIQSKDKQGEPPLSLRAQCISSVAELRSIEHRLSRELSETASQQGGKLQLFPPSLNKDAADVEPEPVELTTRVKTPQDVFDELEAEGFNVKLRRAMLNGDAPPEPEEMDEVLAAVRAASQTGAAVVFSCGNGGERTELAMVLSAIMLAVESGAEPRGYVDPLEAGPNPDLKEKAQFAGIVELCQHFGPRGPVVKAVVDDVIDDHTSLVHFRKGIHECWRGKGDKSKAVCDAMNRLETYWYLIAVGEYLSQQVTDRYQQNFNTWLKSKRAIKRSLHKLCLV